MSLPLIAAAFLVALALVPMFGASDAKAYSQTGIASYYWQGRSTASGEPSVMKCGTFQRCRSPIWRNSR